MHVGIVSLFPALLEAFAGTKRVLLDLLQQPSTPRAPHLEPADLGDVKAIGLLIGRQKLGHLVSPSSPCLSGRERQCSTGATLLSSTKLKYSRGQSAAIHATGGSVF